MLQSQSRIYQTRSFEVPGKFETLADTGIEIVRQAHTGELAADLSTVRTSSDREADRVFIERKLPEASRDYEFLALHLGATSLTVCMEHRHDHRERVDEYHRTSLVFRQNDVRAYHTGLVNIGPTETLTDNEEAGQKMTDRLFHTLGLLGISVDTTFKQHSETN